MSYPENPVLLEYRRGDLVESVHRGAFVLLRDGESVESSGETGEPYFLRSTAKLFQALPLLETGAAKRFGLSDGEIALIAASHNGEDAHRAAAQSILQKGGFAEADLRCGTHPPFDGETAAALRARKENPGALRHNCSGKHGGMLLLAKFLGQDRKAYLDPDGKAQRQIRATVAELCGIAESEIRLATDGCSAPTFALPLRSVAAGFARLMNPEGLRQPLRAACESLQRAIGTNSYLYAGRKQFDTDLVQSTAGRVIGKRGAEGFYALGIAKERMGLALKVDDGSSRMHPFFLISLLRRHSLLREEELAALARHRDSIQKNFAGLVVGELRSRWA